MKYLFLILIALYTSTTFTSCTPTPMAEQITNATEGDDGEVPDDEDEDDDGSSN